MKNRKTALLLIVLLCLTLPTLAKVWHVNISSTSTISNGYYWATPLKSLKLAIDSAKAGDTVKVAAGTYIPGASIESSYILKNKVVLLGGYPATDSTLDRNFSINKTILSGAYGSSVNDKVRHVIRAESLDNTTILDGFIVENGYAIGNNGIQVDFGGAMNINLTQMQVRNCVFRNNYGYGGGGAIYIRYSSPTFQNCFFLNNESWNPGGAVLAENCTGVKMYNCVFADNSVFTRGSVSRLLASEVFFINNTFFRNTATDYPTNAVNGCMVAESGSTLNISNSIFHANTVNNSFEAPEISVNGSTINLSNSIMQNYSGGGNSLLAVNPRFKDTAGIAGPDAAFFTDDDGLQLLAPCSPGLNTGSNTAIGTVSTDMRSKPRIFSNTVDLGAYETQVAPTTPLKVIYVNAQATGSNDGSSWQNAFTSMQQALLYCADTIKVAAGSYVPSANNPALSFWLHNKIVILGGYPATGNPGDAQRDPALHITRLSGALPNAARSVTVVYSNLVDSTCILDGLVISDARSQSIFDRSAVRITNQSNPIFKNCVIENNEAEHGAGLHVDKGARPTFINCRFTGNRSEYTGAAFLVRNQAKPYFLKCEFLSNIITRPSNTLDGDGGAGTIVSAGAVFDTCIFKKNFANWNGGALMIKDSSAVQVRGCKFFGNIARNGGGDVYHKNQAIASYSGCLFSDSTYNEFGGAVMNDQSTAVFDFCEFRGGQGREGGAVYNLSSTATFRHCLFYANTGFRGGVFYNASGSNVSMINCVATGNSCNGASGSVAYNSASQMEVLNSTMLKNKSSNGSTFKSTVFTNNSASGLTVKNSIMWMNEPGLRSYNTHFIDIDNMAGSTATLFNTATQFYGANGVNGNFVGVNPKVVDYFVPAGPDNKFFTADDGLRLSACSPMLNAGDNTYLGSLAIDVLGSPRIFNSATDIGAFEYQSAPDMRTTMYVNKAAAGTGDGFSWANAYRSFHTALANTCADTVKVAEGKYYPAVTDKDSTFFVRQGQVLFGGYPSTGAPADNLRNPNLYPVVLSGNIGNPNDSLDNSKHVVTFDHTDGPAILDGFTVQDGVLLESFGNALASSGAGIHVTASDVTIRNSIIQNNTTQLEGGGIFVGTSKFKLQKVVIRNNKANSGGGLSLNSPATIENSVFTGNYASQHGGGFFSSTPDAQIINTIFHNNFAVRRGGGAYNNNPGVLLANFDYINCAFIRNGSTYDYAGGLYVNQVYNDSKASIYNSVFRENTTGTQMSDMYYSSCSQTNNTCYYTNTIFNTMAQGGITTNPVTGNPGFINIDDPAGPDGIWLTTDDGLQPTHCSALINRGNTTVVANVPNDILDSVRTRDNVVDLGPYEFRGGLYGTAIVNSASDSSIANKEITDAASWTHYFRDCKYLLSIKKDGRNIGSVANGSLKIGVVANNKYNTSQAVNMTAAQFNASGDPLYAGNKYWFVESGFVITDSMQVRFPYSNIDFSDLKGHNPTLTVHEDLEFYKATSYPYNLQLPADSILFYQHDSIPSTAAWKHIVQDHYHVAEFYVKSFGTGAAITKAPGILSDLVIGNLTLSRDTVATAASVTAYARVKNIGTAQASPHKTGFYLSADTTLQKASDIKLGSGDVTQSLQPGQLSDSVQLQYTIPCTTAPGTYYLIAAADDLNGVGEFDESNNNKYTKLVITQGPPVPTGVTITSNRSSDTLCLGDSALLTATIAPACSGCTYSWSTGSAASSIMVKSSGSYAVNAGNVCGQVSSSRTISFKNPPSILPMANPGQVCLGDSTILYESLGTDADSIVWTGPGISALTGNQVKIKPPSAGVLQYTETAYTQDRRCVTSQKVNVQVVSGPPPSLQITNSGCADPMVFSISSLANGGVNPVIRWYRNDTLINTGDSVISLSQVLKGTSIHATVKISTPCAASDSAVSNTIVVDCINGRNNIPGLSSFSILPNPSNGRFVVRMQVDEPSKIALAVYNAYGNQVRLFNETTLNGFVQRAIDLQTQPPGVYYLRLWINGNTYMFRLLVVR